MSTIELDPWGGHTNRNNNDNFQPQKFTSYTRDGHAVDDAMFRRYNRWFARFDQPDPYDGSYNDTDPQSLNRYAYVKNDPVNFEDPFGLEECGREDVCFIFGPTRPTGGVTGTFGGGDTGITIDDPSGGEGPVPLPGDLEDRVAKRVNNPDTDCKDFIKKIIDEVGQQKAHSNDPMVLFKRIQDGAGFHLKKMKESGTANFHKGKRIVHIKVVGFAQKLEQIAL